MKTSLRKMLLTSIVVTVLMGVTMTISSTVLSLSAAAPVAYGESTVLDSEQSVTVTTTNGIDQDNSSSDRHTSSLRITQSPENGLDVECGGDLKCEIFENNTVLSTTAGENASTMISDAFNALNQSLNQSNIILPPFVGNDFDILNEQEDLDSELDEWIDRILNDTLGDLPAPLQTPPDLRSVSV
ncbi:MAG TPA: hypothetical protein VJ695_01645 [Nitrososphaera sp.]|nr:hypothetical protein [Nitrososphaera sp.]